MAPPTPVPSAANDPLSAEDQREEGNRVLLSRLGEAVRTARGQRGLSRKLVSEMSGVSLRYLAQLESGTGNISITLLRQVAEAINVPLAWLIAQADDRLGAAVDLAGAILDAPPAQREQIRQILSQGSPTPSNRIALIGLRGAGKSTLGQLSARRLGLPFVELNSDIEAASGMSVSEVFNLYGQEGYRRLERTCLEDIIARDGGCILETGGGIVSEPATFARLLSAFTVVWLRALPEEHMARVIAQGDNRPMADNPQAMEELRTILTSRESQYAKAPIHLSTTDRTVEEALEELLSLLHPYLSQACSAAP